MSGKWTKVPALPFVSKVASINGGLHGTAQTINVMANINRALSPFYCYPHQVVNAMRDGKPVTLLSGVTERCLVFIEELAPKLEAAGILAEMEEHGWLGVGLGQPVAVMIHPELGLVAAFPGIIAMETGTCKILEVQTVGGVTVAGSTVMMMDESESDLTDLIRDSEPAEQEMADAVVDFIYNVHYASEAPVHEVNWVQAVTIHEVIQEAMFS